MDPGSSSFSSEHGGGAGIGHTVVERPPAGLARGKYPAPAWGVAALGVAIVVGGIAYAAGRFLRRARR